MDQDPSDPDHLYGSGSQKSVNPDGILSALSTIQNTIGTVNEIERMKISINFIDKSLKDILKKRLINNSWCNFAKNYRYRYVLLRTLIAIQVPEPKHNGT